MSEEYREALDWLRSCESDQLAGSEDPGCSYVATQLHFAIEVLENCAVDPIPLSEREPEEDDYEDHNGESWFWAGRQTAIGWRWMPDGSPLGAMSDGYTHWLLASTKYLPARV